MATEVQERIRAAIETAAEQVEQFHNGEGVLEHLDVALGLLDQLPRQLELPLWDDKVHADASRGIAWKHVGGHKVVVSLEDVDLLTRPLEIISSVKADVRRVSTIRTVRRVADGLDSERKGGNAPLGRVVLARRGLWRVGLHVDHLDHDPLNCSRSNLEAVTAAENTRRRRPYGKSQYLYVSPVRNKWRASVWANDKVTHSGGHATEIEAARAGDALALALNGPNARTNVSIGKLPPIEQQLDLAV